MRDESLIAPLESIVAKVANATYANRFREAFGDDVFGDSARAFKAVLLSLEIFQQSPEDFYPYSSRYDAWLRGSGRLTLQEQRGLALFEDPKKGNCASCHPNQKRGGAHPSFSPEKWYPRDRDGRIRRYDDLPAKYRGNVNRDPPFDRKPNEAPALSKSEIDDVIAFLKTLTDADVATQFPLAKENRGR